MDNKKSPNFKFDKIPIFGGLFKCRRPSDYWNAFVELFVTLIISTSPLWGGAFIICALDKTSNITYINLYINALDLITNNGELFLYATSILAPITYMALGEWPKGKDFPNRISHMIIILAIMFLSGAVFGLKRSGKSLNEAFISPISLVVFLLSIALLYTAMVYRNNRMNTTASDVKSYEKDFTLEYMKHR